MQPSRGRAPMRIVDLGTEHLEAARRLAAEAYARERTAVPALPDVAVPDLGGFAGNGLGVAALEGDRLVGFLGCLAPWDGVFGHVRGTFAPIHAHGTVAEGRGEVYDRLYQVASGRWVASGILSHAIGLYAHDETAQRCFVDNGFGGRTIDAVRDLRPVRAVGPDALVVREATIDDVEPIAELSEGLAAYLHRAPMFMPVRSERATGIAHAITGGTHRYVLAFDRGRAVGYLRWEATGETFASEDPSMRSITGAFTRPDARRGGVATALLAWLIDRLREEGYERCGVDLESFNPLAHRFWLRHFTPYTLGVVRRIDERIVER